jgi:hypothetical protein
MREIRLRMRREGQGLVPVGETQLALKSGDYPFIREPDDPKFSAPGNKERPANGTARPLIHNPGTEDRRKTSQQGQEKFFHSVALMYA